MKRIFFFLIAICSLWALPQTASAQLEVKQRYEKETIYLAGASYIKDGTTHRRGWMAKNLQSELSISPDAMKTFRKSRQNRWKGIGFYLAGVGMLLTAPAASNDVLRTGLLAGGLATSLISVPLAFRSERQLQKAVWERNRDLLFE
ncbi:MAG: hypothetical protein AAFV95_07310 [Bacteroidota bacterium]